MKTTGKPQGRIPPAVRFRDEIERAETEGATREEMTLRLTHGDASLLKRDRNLAMADISFADGTMRFLGVKTDVGGVAVSELVRPE